MLLTIDIKDSAYDKIMYFLKNLKDDVKVIEDGFEKNDKDILCDIRDALNEVKEIEKNKTSYL